MARNIRVEARRLSPNASRQERERSTQQLLRVFKRACNEANVMQDYYDHEYFIRPTDIRRRKKLNKIRATQLGQEGIEVTKGKTKNNKDRERD